jgi:hypothetical protein
MEQSTAKFQASYYEWTMFIGKTAGGEWNVWLESPDGSRIDSARTRLFEDDAKSDALELARTSLADLQDTRPQLSSVEWIPAEPIRTEERRSD